MKKLILTGAGIICFVALTIGQPAVAKPAPVAPPEKVQMTKEQRMEMKAKQESDLNEAYAAAGLSAEQIAKSKEIYLDANLKLKELKANDKMTEEEKVAAKKVINDDKTVKLKALMGDKYKAFNAERKKQKVAMDEKKTAE